MSNPRIKIKREQLLRALDGHLVQIQTPVGMLEIEADVDTAWQPLTKIAVPRHIILHHRTNDIPPPNAMFVNDTYEVMVYSEPERPLHLSIKRYDRAAIRNWRHFQQIKNEIAGEFSEGVELFPSEARIADNANQFHLWVFPEGEEIPIGWEQGCVVIDPEDVEAYNAMGRGRQEPMQPGLTVGRPMNDRQKELGIHPQDALREAGL